VPISARRSRSSGSIRSGYAARVRAAHETARTIKTTTIAATITPST
jgi:hypothetical protein